MKVGDCFSISSRAKLIGRAVFVVLVDRFFEVILQVADLGFVARNSFDSSEG